MKKGFTLIELLSVIIILAIILVIAVPQVLKAIDKSKTNVYINNNQMVLKSAELFVANNTSYLPSEIGNTLEVTIQTLIDNNVLKEFKLGNDDCNGYVLITKINEFEYSYTPHLKCGLNIYNSDDDMLVAHYKFDDFQESTKNLIPNSPINSYPKVGNSHGTYNTNQYNSNNYFSIGNILNVQNNIVTLSSVDRPINTYDVLTPLTTGGGVTAGINYFIKKHSANTFSLHQYNNVQDGSLGFAVHNSINNDIRIPINSTNFPTMWIGRPHLPNSALVKEIIPNCFSSNNQLHECIRLHTNHKPEGAVDGMAYSVNPQVVQGEVYTFSFYYRASNPESVGTRVHLNLHTGASWAGSGTQRTVSSEWQRYELTTTAPNSGGTSLYFWPTKGAVIDISEIQCENKSYTTPYVENERIGIVKDYSGSNNNFELPLLSTPKWERNGRNNNNVYDFNGINNYMQTNSISVGGSMTTMYWIKPSSYTRVTGGLDSRSNNSQQIRVSSSTRLLPRFYDNNGTMHNFSSSYETAHLINKWQHHALVFDADNKVGSLYVNGELVLEENFNSYVIGSGTAEFVVGSQHNYVSEDFVTAKYDDMRIYNRFLSGSEIKLIYESTK